MIEPILVSIITPTFRHSKFIGSCIESVLDQSYSMWELIVIDDGSDDDTPELVNGFVKQDPRIRLVRNVNKGIHRLAETYNEALSLCNGSWVAVLEGDDIWHKDKLQVQVGLISKNPEVIFCYSQAQKIHGEKVMGGPIPKITDQKLEVFSNEPIGSFFHLIGKPGVVPAVSAIIHKAVLKEIGGFYQHSGLPLVDYTTWFKLVPKGRFLFIPLVLCYWRQHEEQATRKHMLQISESLQSYSLLAALEAREGAFVKYVPSDSEINWYYRRRLTREGVLSSCEKNRTREAGHLLTTAIKHYAVFSIWFYVAILLLLSGYLHIPLCKVLLSKRMRGLSGL